MTYGEKIKHVRKRHGMSATVLAKNLGVSQPTISQVEKGMYQLSDENTLAMAKLFNVPVDYFLNNSYHSLDEFDLDVKKTKLLNNNNLMNYIVLAENASKNDVSIEELEQAINFIIELKKKNRESN